MKKHIKHALVCLLIMVMALAALTGCGGKKQIDLHDYVEVTLASANGYGEARAVTDDASLEALVLSDGAEKKSDLEILAMWDLLAKIDYTLDKTEHLSNGDLVTVTVTYPDALEEALNAKITPKSGDSWTVEVKDLPELYTFDLFGNIEVSFYGFDGYGQCDVQVNGGDNVGYVLSKEENLSNGDVVTVTLTGPNGSNLIDYCINQEFLPEVESKEFTVSGLEEIPQIDLFEDLDVTVEGREPFLDLAICGKYDNIEYKVTTDGRLEGGDEVTIRAYVRDWFGELDLEEYCLDELKALPASEVCTYVIPEQQEYYIMEQAQLTEEILSQAIAEAEDLFDSQSKGVEISSVNYKGYWLKTAKNDELEVDHCFLYIIHEVKYSLEGKTYTAYNVVSFNDAFVDAKGKFRSAGEESLYGWFWEAGVEDLYDFEQAYIVSYNADYNSVSGK